jgi:hypothetical protein
MSARKLSRVAGLVFVLAAILGGVGAASKVAQHETGGSATASATFQLHQASETVWG